jgi:hypothetical protein
MMSNLKVDNIGQIKTMNAITNRNGTHVVGRVISILSQASKQKGLYPTGCYMRI